MIYRNPKDSVLLDMCGICGVPLVECFDKPGPIGYILKDHKFVKYMLCGKCEEESHIRCSLCDRVIPDCKLPIESLDDGPCLCKSCTTESSKAVENDSDE